MNKFNTLIDVLLCSFYPQGLQQPFAMEAVLILGEMLNLKLHLIMIATLKALKSPVKFYS